MTYCVGIAVNDGMVFVSDSRTNAGVDHVSTYSKVNVFGVPGERQFVILTAGNLATSQAVISQVRHDIKQQARTSLLTCTRMSEAADYLGDISRTQQAKHGGGPTYESTFILGGQIKGIKQKMLLVYSEGNHIATSEETAFLQIGESKYGKPILDRIIQPDTPIDTAMLCALVSMDSTMRSNLTVGPPIDIIVYNNGSLVVDKHYRLTEDSSYLRDIRSMWDQRLKEAFQGLPRIEWARALVSSNHGQTGASFE
jgi:putative proteasome-type protease